MLLAVHPEIEEIQSKLKEILYDCAVEVRATKAALYLFDAQDNRYELITEYGFRGAVRSVADQNDPIVDRASRGRTAFFVNGLMAEPRFSEILYESSTDRILVAPLYMRGQLVGYVDMRDKAAKQPFDNADLAKATKIGERILDLFSNKNVFGQRFIAVASAPAGEPAFTGIYAAPVLPANSGQVAAIAPPPPAVQSSSAPHPALRSVPSAAPALAPMATPMPMAPVVPPAAAGRVVPKLSQLVAQAQAAAQLLKSPQGEPLTDAEVMIAREILRMALFIPGAVATVFSAAHLGGIQEMQANSAIGEDAVNALRERVDTWMKKRGEAATFGKRNVIGAGGTPLAASDIQKVFTAPLQAGPTKGLYLTVAFKVDPDRTGHDLLASIHRQLQNAIEHSLERRTNNHARRRAAEALLEPDWVRYPELRQHTECVVKRVDQFARFLALSPAEIENARLAAIVHDVGMRLLDYDRLYRKRDLSHDERELLHSHVAIGAALVEPVLGREVARAVYCHHERWDGGGYPNDLRGTDIPLLSRVVQICDVFESMVNRDNYQLPQSYDQAMTVINRGAGIQFDPDLAGRFAEMMRSAR